MEVFGRIPFFRLLLPFLGGIILGIYVQQQVPFLSLGLLIFFLVTLAFIVIRPLSARWAQSWITGLLISATLFLSGLHLTICKTGNLKEDHISKVGAENVLALARITSAPLEKERSLKFSAEILNVKGRNGARRTSGNALLYFSKDSSSKKIAYGDLVLIRTSFHDVPPPQNPSEFNYKQFLAFHNCWNQAFVRAGDWKPLGENRGNLLMHWSLTLRDKLLNVFSKNDIQGDQYSVGAALILGYEDKLDQDIVMAYASTGALHVLSVSGLHVGIIYILLNLLLGFMDKFRYGKFLKAIILVSFLWFYALLTGLSPSVLRSAMMFSFVIAGKVFLKSHHILNTIAVSAFVLLCVDPYLIMDVGFQLSYVALTGIVIFQPPLYESWVAPSKLLEMIWGIVTVSIAAQLATFPLGLLYYHQFPVYFLFSNLIVIPLSSLVLYIGMFNFAVAWIPGVVYIVSRILDFVILALNESVRFIERLPGALIQGISITITETWGIYCIIVMAFLFFTKKKMIYFRLSLVLLTCLLAYQVFEFYKEHSQKKFIVYCIPKMTGMDFIYGKSDVLVGDSALVHDESRMLFHIRHNWWDNGINENKVLERKKDSVINDVHLFRNSNYFEFYCKRIVLADSNLRLPRRFTGKKIDVDYIVLSGNPRLSIDRLSMIFSFRKLIIDASNSVYRAQRWAQRCSQLNVPCYSVYDSGAFIETYE